MTIVVDAALLAPLAAAGLAVLLAGWILVRPWAEGFYRVLAAILVLTALVEGLDVLSLATPAIAVLWRRAALSAELVRMVLFFWLGASLIGSASGEADPRAERWTRIAGALALVAIGATWWGAFLGVTPERAVRLGALGKPVLAVLLVGLVLAIAQLERVLRATRDPFRYRIKYVLLGVGALACYEVYVTAQALLVGEWRPQHAAAGGLVTLASVLLVGYGLGRMRLARTVGRVDVSPQMVYGSVTLLAVGLYLLGVGLLGELLEVSGRSGDVGVAQLVVFVLTVVLVVGLLSRAVRARFRAFVSRNLLRSRYNYRTKWLETTDAFRDADSEEEILDHLLELLARTFGTGRLSIWMRYEADDRFHQVRSTNIEEPPPPLPRDHPVVAALGATDGPLDLESLAPPGPPDEFLEATQAVLGVPVRGAGELQAFVVLGPAPGSEGYDTDDRDLLRAITHHAGVLLAHAGLADERQAAAELDALNRFSAFYLHDFKNLTARLSLVAQNAVRHGDDPEFRASALKTVGRTAEQMNELISKLAHRSPELGRVKTVDLCELVQSTVDSLGPDFGAVVEASDSAREAPVLAVREQLQQVVLNLVLNARKALDAGLRQGTVKKSGPGVPQRGCRAGAPGGDRRGSRDCPGEPPDSVPAVPLEHRRGVRNRPVRVQADRGVLRGTAEGRDGTRERHPGDGGASDGCPRGGGGADCGDSGGAAIMKRQARWTIAFLLVLGLGSSGCGLADDFRMNRHLKKAEQYYTEGKFKEATIEYRNVLRYDPENLDAVKKLGLAYYQSGQIGEAFPPLRRYHDQNPGDLEVRLKLGTIYLLGRAPERAREQAAAILEEEPTNLDALALYAEGAQTPEELQEAIARIEGSRDALGSPDRVSLILGVLFARTRDLPRAEQEFEAAVESAPDSAETHLALARLNLGKGEMEAAEEEFKAAAALSSAESFARLQLADFYLLTLRTDDAVATLEAIVAEAPDAFPAWLRLSEIAFTRGRLEEAQAALDHVLEPSPDDALGLVLQTRLQLARRETDAALKTATRATKRYPGSPLAHHSLALAHAQEGNTALALTSAKDSVARNPTYADAVLLTARLEMQTGDFVGAIAGLEAYLAQQPRDPRAWEMLGQAQLRNRNVAAAREAFAKVAELAPASPKGPYLSGVTLRAEGRNAEARQQFERALAMAPGYVDPLAQLAAMSLVEKKPEEAIQRIERQALLEPGSAAIQLLLGQVYGASGSLDKAEQCFRKSVELNPNQMAAYAFLGQIYGNAQDHDRAIGELEKALEANPDQPVVRMLWSISHHMSGNEAKAREGYEQLLEANPNFAPAANNLAYMLAEEEDGKGLPRAFLLAQAARDAAPEDAQIADTLGWVLYKQGAYPRAEALFMEAAEKLPDNGEVIYHLGLAQKEMMKNDEARTSFTRAVGLGGNAPWVEKAREALGELDQ